MPFPPALSFNRLRGGGFFLCACLLLSAIAGPASAGPAVNQFELKDLESAPGYLQFQSQNAWSFGQPSRATAVLPNGERAYDDNSVGRQREALEMEMGFTTWLKMRIGIEFEQDRIDDPLRLSEANQFADLILNGVGGELIAVLVPRDGNGIGLGVVAEIEKPFERSEQMQLNTGLILEWASGPWSASLVPTVVSFFRGEANDEGRFDNKLDFAYAFQALYTASPAWAFGLEAYGTIDRLGSSGSATEAQRLFGDHDQHRAGPIVYYTRPLEGSAAKPAQNDAAGEDAEGSTVTVGLGYLAGLNENTADGTLKLSVEVDF